MEHVTGLVAPVVTPMHTDGSVNLEPVGKIVDHLERTGVVGVFICGSTGEGLSLSVEEREETTAAFAEAAKGRLHVIVHVGHNSLTEARRLASHAQELGADAIAACPPSYFKPPTVEILARCCREISDAAPGLPFYYYHIPALSGVHVRVIELLRAAEKLCPALTGVKFTFEDLMDYQQCVEFAGGKYDVLFGRDEILLSALVVGGRGAVGSSYNYAATLYNRIIEAFDRGDLTEARRLQHRAAGLIDIVHRHGGACCHKTMMKRVGIDCGPARLPLTSPGADAEKQLEADLREIGFFEWIA